MRLALAGLTLALVAPAAPACAGAADSPAPARPTASSASSSPEPSAAPAARRGAPSFTVRRLTRGLSHVWDVKAIGNGGLLLTERDTATLRLLRHGRLRTVAFPSGRVWVSGETGLMSLEVDPGFARNRRFYTCQGGFTATGHDVRVMAWKLADGGAQRGQPGQAARRDLHQQWPPRRVPAADRAGDRRAVRRHG